MTAVPEMRVSGPVVALPARTGVRTGPARIVAVAGSITELTRPESDLARILDSVGVADLLVACEDGPGPLCAPTPLFSYLDYPDYDDDPDPVDVDPVDVDPVDLDYDEDEDDQGGTGWTAPEPREPVEPMAARDGDELPGVRLHRLGLPQLSASSEDDLVAAMSELVGFDPEPGVYCLAPITAPDDAARSVLVRAAERIAQVYGLPLLSYRCLELAVVPGEG